MRIKEYFIGQNGKIYLDEKKNANVKRYDTSRLGIINSFCNKEFAILIRDHIDDYKPMEFYGKRCKSKSDYRQ